MASSVGADYLAGGKVISANNGVVIFRPDQTNYQLHLATGGFNGQLNKPVRCRIRVTARKVYTVPSGGSFITPILGTPRIVQGLVRSGDANRLVLQAGCPIHVELPKNDNAIDLDDGAIAGGRLVNVVCEPGASIEFP